VGGGGGVNGVNSEIRTTLRADIESLAHVNVVKQ